MRNPLTVANGDSTIQIRRLEHERRPPRTSQSQPLRGAFKAGSPCPAIFFFDAIISDSADLTERGANDYAPFGKGGLVCNHTPEQDAPMNTKLQRERGWLLFWFGLACGIGVSTLAITWVYLFAPTTC